MNTIIWASMQSLDCLEAVDRMIPDLVSERDWEEYRRKKLRARRGNTSSRRQRTTWRHVIGSILMIIGVMMLMPGPTDFTVMAVGMTVGTAIGLSLGGAIAMGIAFVVATYVVAVAFIAIGAWLLAT